MTRSAVATRLRRPALLTRVASAVRASSAEALVFSIAAVVALLHALDDAFLLPGGGVPLTQHALAASIALVATVLAVVRFPSLRPGIRAAVAFTFGVLAAVNGGRHAFHIVNEGGMTANDVTGALALVAGGGLVALAPWVSFPPPGGSGSPPGGRRGVRGPRVAAILPPRALPLLP